jgi:hypothetical protein
MDFSYIYRINVLTKQVQRLEQNDFGQNRYGCRYVVLDQARVMIIGGRYLS